MTAPAFADVAMFHPDLTAAPEWAFPNGYRMRGYSPGDDHTWLRIQHASDDGLASLTVANFHADMPGEDAFLARRVLFLTDPYGVDIGTITAWSDARFDGVDRGHVHWVAIVKQAQGRGLSKPMLSAVCARLIALGYPNAYLETNTALAPALNLYRSAGFAPHPRNDTERVAWREASERLGWVR